MHPPNERSHDFHHPSRAAAPRRPAATATPANRASRGLGVLLILDGLLSFAPLAVLGTAIGWPASLGNPAAE